MLHLPLEERRIERRIAAPHPVDRWAIGRGQSFRGKSLEGGRSDVSDREYCIRGEGLTQQQQQQRATGRRYVLLR